MCLHLALWDSQPVQGVPRLLERGTHLNETLHGKEGKENRWNFTITKNICIFCFNPKRGLPVFNTTVSLVFAVVMKLKPRINTMHSKAINIRTIY